MMGMTKSPLNRREAMWAAMLKLTREAGRFCARDVQGLSNSADKRSVLTYIKALEKAGYVELLNPDAPPRAARYYRVLRRVRRAPRLRRDGQPAMERRGQQQMWNAMRQMGSFDWHELAAVASTDDCAVKPSTARRYMGMLHRAGYLTCLNRPAPGRRGRWRLRINSGPRAPVIVRAVRDPNTGELHMGDAA